MVPCILDGTYHIRLIKFSRSKDSEAPAVQFAVEGAEFGVLAGSVGTRRRRGECVGNGEKQLFELK